MCKDLEENVQKICIFAVIQYVKDHSKVWHRYEVRYKKIQKDMIFVPMPYYGISIGHIYNKKADRCLCSAFNTAYKKSGTAILLFRILRLWYCLCNKQQHRSPRRTYIYYLRYTPMRVRVYTYHRHLSVAMFCYFQRNLPDFRMPKQSA